MCTQALHPSRAPLDVRHLPERPPQLPAIYSRSRRTVMRTPSVVGEVVGVMLKVRLCTKTVGEKHGCRHIK